MYAVHNAVWPYHHEAANRHISDDQGAQCGVVSGGGGYDFSVSFQGFRHLTREKKHLDRRRNARVLFALRGQNSAAWRSVRAAKSAGAWQGDFDEL